MPDWHFRLVAYAQANRGRPFRWGTTDCYSIVRGALDVVYDADVLPAAIYSRQAAALRVAQSFKDIPGALEELGAQPVAMPFAQAGDLLLIPGKDELGLPRFGVIADGRGHVLTSDVADGVVVVDATEIPAESVAWRWPR